MKQLIVCAATALTVLGPVAGNAGDEAVFNRLDADKNGRISRDELLKSDLVVVKDAKGQRAGGITRLVLNLQGVDYISSAGLRSLLAAAKQLKTHNGILALCCLGGTVEEVFRISGFLSILPSFPSVEAACASFQ